MPNLSKNKVLFSAILNVLTNENYYLQTSNYGESNILLLRHFKNMKKTLTLLFLAITIIGYTQEKKKQKPIKKDFVMIDINYSSLINAPKNVTFDVGYGMSFQMYYDYQFKVKQLSGALGVAYSHDSYYSNAFLSFSDSINGDYYQFYPFSDLDSNVKTNKYVTNYLDIPLELRFRSLANKNGHSWKASVGFRVGLRLGSHTRTITDKGRFQNYNYDALQRIRYGVTARFGYGRMGVVGYYGLSTLFEKGRGHELIPWSVGFTITPF